MYPSQNRPGMVLLEVQPVDQVLKSLAKWPAHLQAYLIKQEAAVGMTLMIIQAAFMAVKLAVAEADSF